jgi:hypothetical protein
MEEVGVVMDTWGNQLVLKVIHNSEALRKQIAQIDRSVALAYPAWSRLVAVAVKDEFAAYELRVPPRAPSLRAGWAISQVKAATARLADARVASQVADKVVELTKGMKKGKEEAHLAELLKWTDYRGSDVKLTTGELYEGSRQECPYPATLWKWQSVLAWPWRQHQHINVLEFTAFLT